jgi:thymidylate kinase
MKLLILEGIATSGKTTVKNNLINFFKKEKLKYLVIEEDETLMPILNNTEAKVSIDYLKKILKKVLSARKEDIIIFDRLYFTHIFRTESSLKDFKVIEALLPKKDTFLAFLEINKEKISERIFNALKNERAKTKWVNYIKKKGTNAEITNYYQKQQDLLSNFLKETKIENKTYNTTNLNFDLITKNILKEMGFMNY